MNTIQTPLVEPGTPQASAQAEDREWVPYRNVVEGIRLDKFEAVPANKRDKLQLMASVEPMNKATAPGSVVVTVAHAGGRLPIQVSPDGKLALPFNKAWLDEEAKLWVNQPKGDKIGLRPALIALMPDGTQCQYADLLGCLAQANDLIKSQAGRMSMFAPSLKAVVLRFAQPATVKIMAKGGIQSLATDATNTVRLAMNKELMQENPQIELSERPLRLEPN